MKTSSRLDRPPRPERAPLWPTPPLHEVRRPRPLRKQLARAEHFGLLEILGTPPR